MGLVLVSTLAFSGTVTVSVLKDTLYEITSDVENKRVAQIKESIKGANERLADFSITREGDVITLGFTMWTGGDKVEFNLVGKKPDYYRMAMGVSIEDTLKVLAKSDKRIAPVSATKDSKTINLTVMFGEGGKTPVPPKSAKPAKPNRVSAKAPQKAAPVKAEPPKPITQPITEDGLNAEDSLWQRIKDTGTTADFEQFLKSYPKSMHKYAAKRKIAEVANRAVEERKKEHEKKKLLAKEAEKKKAEQKRLEKEKQKRIAAENKKLEKQKKINADKKRLAAEKKKQADLKLAAKKVVDAFEKAKKAGTTKALDSFIKQHPKSKLVTDAKKLSAAKHEDEAYDKAKKTRKGVEKYLKQNPKGKHAKAAKTLLGKMHDDEMFMAAKGSIDKLESYLKKYPKGRHTKEADGMVDKLLSVGSPRLRAPLVKVAPTLDGKADDTAWKNVRPLTLSLKRKGKGTHIPKVTVKAVHSDGTLYILAQWKDKSMDTEYRPYIWDEATKKHVVTETMDDAFAVGIYKGSVPGEPCMQNGESQAVDIWMWRAYLSEISGLASDQSIVTSRKRMRKSSPHLAQDGSGQIWIRNLPDRGKQGWKYVVPKPDAPHESIPSYIACEPSGSAGDVKARGSWNKGVWTVEFSRILKTNKPDDADISEESKNVVSFAAYDKADRENHSSGTFVRLEIQR